MELSKKILNYNLEKKVIFISIIYSIIVFIISLFFLFLNPYVLYGTLYGLFVLWISIISIGLFKKYVSFKDHVIFYTWGLFLIRVTYFLTSFLILILVIDTTILVPINSISYLITYLIFAWATLSTPLLDYILNKIAKDNNK